MEEKHVPTLKEAVEQYLAYLTEIGKRPGTVATYGKDFDLAIKPEFSQKPVLLTLIAWYCCTFFANKCSNTY
ncbi:MAG: hypothetical protein ACYSTS_19590 [Planctomycetota bacterium]|jgi:hypothetical protein